MSGYRTFKASMVKTNKQKLRHTHEGEGEGRGRGGEEGDGERQLWDAGVHLYS